MKIRTTVRRIISVFLLCCIIVSIAGCSSKVYYIKYKTSLIELNCRGMAFSDEERRQLNSMLNLSYYEDSELCGFVSADYNYVDLYTAVNIINMAELLGNTVLLDSFRQDLSFLKSSSLDNYGILNILYYTQICDILGYSYDENAVREALMQYYDKSSGMFFVNGKDDFFGIKCSVSSLCVEKCRDIISDIIPEMKQSAERELESYLFLSDSEATLYNSGGDILVYCSLLGIDCSENINTLNEWYQTWREKYMTVDTSTVAGCLQYADFLEVASLFENVYPDRKIQTFYENLTATTVENTSDIQMLYNILKNADILDNDEVNKLLNDKLLNVSRDGLFSKVINPRTTAYALALAYWTGFSYDQNKINVYLDNQYDALPEIQNIYDKAATLYYLVGIDQMNNNYTGLRIEDKKVQKAVDDILGHLSGKKDAAVYEIEAIRKTIEVVADLQIFKINVNIKEKYIPKIKTVLKNVLNDDELCQSVLAVEVAFISERLGFSFADEGYVDNAFRKLKTDKGVKSFDLPDVEPDIYSTVLFLYALQSGLYTESRDTFSSFAVYYSMEDVLSRTDINPMELYLICYLNKGNYSLDKK